MVMCHRDSDRAAFGTITLIELTWNDSSWKHRTLTLFITCISLTAAWPSVWCHTCDRKRSVVGLSELLLDFFPSLFLTGGLSGTWRSNLTLVSPTHRAKYLLDDHTTCSHLNLKWYKERCCIFMKTWQRLTASPGSAAYLKSRFCQLPVVRTEALLFDRELIQTHEIFRWGVDKWHGNWCFTRVCCGWNWILTPWTEKSPTDFIFSSAFRAAWKNRTASVHMSHLEGRGQFTFVMIILVNRKRLGSAL